MELNWNGLIIRILIICMGITFIYYNLFFLGFLIILFVVFYTLFEFVGYIGMENVLKWWKNLRE